MAQAGLCRMDQRAGPVVAVSWVEEDAGAAFAEYKVEWVGIAVMVLAGEVVDTEAVVAGMVVQEVEVSADTDVAAAAVVEMLQDVNISFPEALSSH